MIQPWHWNFTCRPGRWMEGLGNPTWNFLLGSGLLQAVGFWLLMFCQLASDCWWLLRYDVPQCSALWLYLAGIVLDLVSTSRVKAWGPHMRRKKCEELASATWQKSWDLPGGSCLEAGGIRQGKVCRFWTVSILRIMCHEWSQLQEQGQFNLKRWRDMSMSLAETLERIQPGA